MDPVFTNALARSRSPGRKCLGVTLRPLTVGHLFLLAELGSPFPENWQDAPDPDFLVAVMVCSAKTGAKARRMLRSPFCPVVFFIWGVLIRFATRVSGFDLKEALRLERLKFAIYLAEQLDLPEPDELSGAPAEKRVPLAWRLQAMLMADFGLTLKESLNAPTVWAQTLWAVESDRRCISRVASERQIAFRQAARELDARRMAAAAAAAEAAAHHGGTENAS